MIYYKPNSDIYYLESDYWTEERDFLLSHQCRLLNVNEANMFNLGNFFQKNDDDIKPILNSDFHYFMIPYELDDEIIDDLSASEIILSLISENLHNKIYLASTDSDKCCFIECNNLDEDILYNLYNTHINTPFIVFDEDANFFALIDFDLPIQIIAFKKNIIDSYNFISNNIGQKGWDDLYQRYSSYINLQPIFNKYYKPLL
ncbi:hypothetical protein [Moraxella osloensis]|uniref:Uncharacterized protein n=1 Tax=Faucicola osloensis TaxID=34062 RepID=A0A2D2LXV0_FAUOS|nr:hypothetical protein [Moraxella osloensis]ATR79854.1 hypothetical protein NP7_10855 [Moraxella osloensis]